MPGDLEDDWATLGRPGKVARAAKKARRGMVEFLDFLFGWCGKAWNGFWATFINDSMALALLVILILGGVSTMVWFGTQSEGRIDYCFIDKDSSTSESETWKLYGHRPWRMNAELGRLTIYEDKDERLPANPDLTPLFEKAKELNCRIH